MEQQRTLPTPHLKDDIQFTPRQYISVFAVFALFVFLAFNVFLSKRFECDSFWHMYSTQLQTAMLHLGGYRFISAIFMWFYSLAGVLDIEAQLFNTVFLLICIALSITILFISLQKKFGPLTKAKLLLLAVAVALVYVNPFVSALALFPEAGAFIGAGFVFVTLAAVIAARKITFFNALISFGLLSAALGTYQPFIGFFAFITFSLMFAEHRLELNRTTLTRSVYFAAILAISSVGNIVIGKALCKLFGVVQNYRVGDFSLQTIVSNIKYILAQQGSVWNGMQHSLPQYLGMIVAGFFLLSIVLCFIVLSVKKMRDKQLHFNGLIGNALLSLGAFALCYASVFAPYLLTDNITFPSRAILSLFSVFLLLVVMLLSVSDSKIVHWVASTVLSIFLMFCVLAVTKMGVSQLMVNALDREYAQQVSQQIAAYEVENGNSVTKISMINDAAPMYQYPSVAHYCAPYYSFINSARVVSWSQVTLIEYVSEHELKRVPMPDDILARYFANKDWVSFVPEEQIVFDGDTLYLVTY